MTCMEAVAVVVLGMCQPCCRTGPPKRECPLQKNLRVNCEKKFFYINLNHINKIIFSYPKLKEATSTVNTPLPPPQKKKESTHKLPKNFFFCKLEPYTLLELVSIPLNRNYPLPPLKIPPLRKESPLKISPPQKNQCKNSKKILLFMLT